MASIRYSCITCGAAHRGDYYCAKCRDGKRLLAKDHGKRALRAIRAALATLRPCAEVSASIPHALASHFAECVREAEFHARRAATYALGNSSNEVTRLWQTVPAKKGKV